MAAYKYVGRTWNVSAQKVGEELELIERQNGEITPQAVVDKARPEDSVMHKCFEWDDETAAEKYRLSQARSLIRCIVVIPDKEDEKINTPVRMFVNQNPINNGQKAPASYINVRTAFDNPETRSVVLANARYELSVFRSKYSQLKELEKLFIEIDKFLSA